MTTKQTFALVAGITLISFFIGWYLYPLLPATVASHWGMNGEVNGHMTKFWGLFFVPFMMIFMSLLLFLLPKIDPLKENIALFQKSYNAIIAGIIVFLFYIHLLTVFWNLGYHFDIGKMIVFPIAFLLYMLGALMPKMKQNWFMGIRTPWTLESARVWDETHVWGGKMYRYSAIVALGAFLFPPPYALFFIIIPILTASFGSIFYSFILFKKYGSDKKI